MTALFKIHLDHGENNFVWWAETEELPTLSVAAGSLNELRTLIDEAAAAHFPEKDVRLELVVDEEPAPFDDAPAPSSVESRSRGPVVRRTPFPLAPSVH